MDDVIYGFGTCDLDGLAASISETLQMRLYLQNSPLHGPWYSSDDVESLFVEIKRAAEQHNFDAIAEINRAAETRPLLELRFCHPDPPYVSEFREEIKCLLRIRERSDALMHLEEKLRASGLEFVELQRKHSPDL